MNKLSFLSILILFSISVNSQVRNVNPDKNSEPWLLGGLRIPSQEEINKIPVVVNSYEKSNKDLPTTLDNSTKPYFRPVFNQTDGSCAQASGIAYSFTYEINRERGTSANSGENQYPSHYTYNFLNNGDGANGSWFWDGWEIIKANGCPNVSTYGGLADNGAKYWMSGYGDYRTNMNNRVKDVFSIDVSTPDGLETLKHWMYDHLEGESDGGLVNFGAGISDGDYNMTWDNIITKWHNSANHAMTFVGWDDNIEYDYNNDGNITNDVDINGDGIVNMQDWEKGALLMVNSWGTWWGNNGKAYVMYKLLADPISEGGIFSNKVYSIHVKESCTPQLTMKVKIAHNSRNKIKIYAGVSSDLSASEPENTISFPLFNKQGGSYDMRGNSSTPIEITLDITPLLSYVNSGENSKFFLLVDENDGTGTSTGQIYDFSIVDNANTEIICNQHNVAIVNDDITTLSLNGNVSFDSPEITTMSLDNAIVNQTYSQQLNATGGTQPYNWSVVIEYNEENLNDAFPIATNLLTPTDYDDGYASKTIDFEFPFFGEEYNQLYISTDGSIVFEPQFSYIRSEDAIKGAKVISVFASDLMIFPANGDGLFYEGDENSATFKWKTSLYGNESANIEVALKLYPSGEIKFFYGDNITDGLVWAAGISYGDRINSVISSNSGIYNPDNEKLRFISIPFPKGMSITNEGVFEGTPTQENGSWNISFAVTDYNNITKIKQLTFATSSSEVQNIDKQFVEIYPNPATDFLNISYLLKNESYVKIQILDITGKIIKTLINEKQRAGDYNVFKNINISSGLYMLRVEVNGNLFSRKLIIK